MDTWKYECQTWYPEEGSTFLGNGYVGGTIPRDGHGATGNPFTATVAGHYVGENEEAGTVPHWLNCPLKIDGQPVVPWWIKFRQVLDLKQGTLTTAYTSKDNAVRVETETFCHRAYRHICAYQITIHALHDVAFELTPHGATRTTGVRTGHLKTGDSSELQVIVAIEPAAVRENYDTLRRSHIVAMAKLWESFNIEVANPFLERKARAQMFYLLSGYRDDVVHGGTATGLSSHASWGGSVFWDTEFYLFPALLLFFPALARNTVAYRHGTLEQARANARQHGEAGARFAWQSKKTGAPFAGSFEDERHISSDVAFCAWWYAHTTGDWQFTNEIIVEVARNWASRAIFNQAADRYEIHNVIPPDEHVWDHHVGTPVNNSVMTNIYAAWVLAKAAALVGGAEAARWQEIAGKLFLPRDPARDIYAEYEGYTGHPIKQADIAHVFFPLPTTVDAAEISRTADYYLDREQETGLFLTHSPSVYGAAFSKAGDVRGVTRCLELSARNFVGPFELPRESNYGGGAVVTGAGSFLNLLCYGILGIDTTGARLVAHPCVPAQIGRIQVSGVQFQGKRYRVAADATGQRSITEPE